MTTVFEKVISFKKRVINYIFERVKNSTISENRIMVSVKRKSKAEYSDGNKEKVKLQRAQGECLGTGSRRRTWLTAISLGEL